VDEVDGLMRHFEPLETHRTAGAPISEQEYVSIIEDALTLAKNVGICRNFELLSDRMALAKRVRNHLVSLVWC